MYNLHSVTSNAVAGAISTEVANRDTAIANAINTEVTNRNNAIGGAINGAVGHSYDEVFTGGYWVDGRPIFRRFFVYHPYTSQGLLHTSFPIPKGKIVDMHAICFGDTNLNATLYFDNANNLWFYQNITGNTFGEVDCYFYYLK